MNKYTNFHSYKTQNIVERFKNGKIIIDDSYQRRSIWLARDKIRLVETILNDFLIPPLYLWDAEIDSETGEILQHIVDGQQRISSIVDFIEGKFKLESRHLMIPSSIEKHKDLFFHELDSEDKKKIWSYEIPAIDLGREVTEPQIRTIFTRLNLTEYSLNNQERRHSDNQGVFAKAAYELAELRFWNDYKLFTASDLRRMKDIEFCASLLLMARRGIVEQTTQKPLNDAYDDYSEKYENLEEDFSRVMSWAEILSKFTFDKTLRFMRKKTQLYSMFCLAAYIDSENIQVTEEHTEKLEEYVKFYDSFKNDSSNEQVPENLLDTITRHKLASSEGIHKQKNRTVRFFSLKDAVFSS